LYLFSCGKKGYRFNPLRGCRPFCSFRSYIFYRKVEKVEEVKEVGKNGEQGPSGVEAGRGQTLLLNEGVGSDPCF
jgi:hypothetical protein